MLTSSALTMRSLPLLGGLAVAAGHTNDGDVKYKIEENVLNVKLPKALSDHTATLVGSQVFIAGGCDDLNGNKYNTDSKNFECGSLSQSFYMLDLAAAETADATFVTLPDMPVERYRHAAAASNGQIWIHGGRNLTDHLINEINVYDIETRSWSIVSGLDGNYTVSDHTAFSFEDYVYFSGGYLADYEAVGTTFRINAVTSNTVTQELVVEDRAPMNVERGDVAAASTSSYAIVGGGFTDDNGFCDPHVHAEQYTFATDSWTEIANMTYGGAERVLVSMGSKIFALGGERQVLGLCDLDEASKPAPGERTITLDKVEWYDIDVNRWTILSDLPDHRFRFPAVAYLDMIFTFGGQLRFDEDCQCFRTTDSVIAYVEKIDLSAAQATAVSSLVILISAITAGFMAVM